MRVAGPLEPLVGNVQSMCLVELRRGALYPPRSKRAMVEVGEGGFPVVII